MIKRLKDTLWINLDEITAVESRDTTVTWSGGGETHKRNNVSTAIFLRGGHTFFVDMPINNVVADLFGKID